ncbi:DEAD/DEAH box helicase [Bacteroidota bacterium]
MSKAFIISVVQHKKLGLLLAPYIIIISDMPFFSLHERVSTANLNKYSSLISDNQKQLVKIIDEYSNQNLYKRFTNKNISVRDFISELDANYIKNHIRPFIEKQISAAIKKLEDSETKIYFISKEKNIYKTDEVIIQNAIAETIFNFHKNEEGTKYFQNIRYQNEQINIIGKKGLILSNKPCKIIIDNKLYQFNENVDAKLLQPFFEKEFIFIPKKIEKKYYSSFILNAIKNQHIKQKGFTINNIQTDAKAFISLENDLSNNPAFILSFAYDKKEIKVNYSYEIIVNLDYEKDKFIFTKIERDRNFEKKIIKALCSLGLINTDGAFFKLPLYNEDEQKLHTLIQWINLNSNTLEKNKITIKQDYFENKYYTGNLAFTSDIKKDRDWFDIHARVIFGTDFELPFVKLCNNIIQGDREFVLPNGEIAILPEEWFEKYRDLALFGKKHQSSLKLNQYHYPILTGTGIVTKKKLTDEIEAIYKLKYIPAYDIPEKLNASLRAYQVEGYNWINLLAQHHLGACLADDMGLGKTIQSLAVLLYQKETKKSDGQLKTMMNKNSQMSLFDQKEIKKLSTSLIIMPASLIHNWINEIMKFTPHLSFCVYTGMNREKLFQKLDSVDIVLTTYGIARNDVLELKSFTFDYMILDESQLIKNPSSKAYQAINQLQAKHKVVLTGTPIENSLSDLWAQMNFINKGLLGNYHFFKEHFLAPIEKHNDEARKEKLKNLIKPFIMRRTKQEVAKELPPLTEEMYYCDMTDEQKEIYQSEKNKIRNHVLENVQKEGVEKSAIVVLQALTKLRQLANHPLLVDHQYKNSSGKFEEVCRNIETLLDEEHKVLIYSSFVKHLEIFSAYFNKKQWEYTLLIGSSTKRKEIIEKFKRSEDIRLFLISLKAGGVGLNLTEADYVFILEPWWNPAVEMQAISRAHRIKQDKNVFVYRFITKDSIEDKIVNLQEKKSTLSNMFINSNNPLKGLTKKHIEDLIS